MALVVVKEKSRLRCNAAVSIRELQASLAEYMCTRESSDLVGALRVLKSITWKTHPKPRQVTELVDLAIEFLKCCPNTKASQPKLKTALLLENRHKTRGPIFLSNLPDDIEATKCALAIRQWLGKFRMMKTDMEVRRVVMDAVRFPFVAHFFLFVLRNVRNHFFYLSWKM